MTRVWGTAGQDALPKLSQWDTVFVANKALPGVARVQGKGVEHGIDIKKTPGKDGAVFSDTGREVAELTITLVLQGQADWDAFEKTCPGLQPLSQTGKLEALAISHPAINVLGIRSVYFKRIGLPHPGAVVGTFEVELEAIEYRPPKGSAGGGVSTPKKDVKNWENGGDGYPPKPPSSKATKPSKTNTGP